MLVGKAIYTAAFAFGSADALACSAIAHRKEAIADSSDNEMIMAQDLQSCDGIEIKTENVKIEKDIISIMPFGSDQLKVKVEDDDDDIKIETESNSDGIHILTKKNKSLYSMYENLYCIIIDFILSNCVL